MVVRRKRKIVAGPRKRVPLPALAEQFSQSPAIDRLRQTRDDLYRAPYYSDQVVTDEAADEIERSLLGLEDLTDDGEPVVKTYAKFWRAGDVIAVHGGQLRVKDRKASQGGNVHILWEGTTYWTMYLPEFKATVVQVAPPPEDTGHAEIVDELPDPYDYYGKSVYISRLDGYFKSDGQTWERVS